MPHSYATHGKRPSRGLAGIITNTGLRGSPDGKPLSLTFSLRSRLIVVCTRGDTICCDICVAWESSRAFDGGLRACARTHARRRSKPGAPAGVLLAVGRPAPWAKNRAANTSPEVRPAIAPF